MSMPPKPQPQVRNYLMRTHFTQEEADLMKVMMLETKKSSEELLVHAFHQMAIVRERMMGGYEQKFINAEGEEFVKPRIILK